GTDNQRRVDAWGERVDLERTRRVGEHAVDLITFAEQEHVRLAARVQIVTRGSGTVHLTDQPTIGLHDPVWVAAGDAPLEGIEVHVHHRGDLGFRRWQVAEHHRFDRRKV